ncbi:uncharacterized protein KD926_004605 [Aspergillus affinis]|uniref:uncharacterized protein n=1 Tax=Aspergillus affinis TaxID=1070780 RepID=UPI0022FDE1D9|nr:uncharacterized protein KD926_004605 [Aspergillus affinis]KAI9043102.1 hypothetical protein KD926_004605 [Aspergillus affinis]
MAIEAELQPTKTGTLALFCITTLELVPESLQSWARKVLAWLISSFRSLTFSELELVSNLSSGLDQSMGNYRSDDEFREMHEPRSKVLQYISGLIDVPNAEARLIFNPSVVTSSGTWYHYSADAQCHELIAEMSLDHLRRDPVRQTLQYLTKLPSMSRWRNAENTLHLYTARYWSDHYNLANKDHQPQELVAGVTKFLQSPDLREAWWPAYTNIRGMPRAEGRQLTGPLTVVAGAGFEGLLDNFLEQHEALDPSALAESIVEASKNGNIHALRTLLNAHTTLETDTVNVAIKAAESNSNSLVLLELLHCHSADNLSGESIGIALRVACLLGLDNVMKFFTESTVLEAHPSLMSNVRPLCLAAKSHSAGVAQLLCDTGIDTVAGDGGGSTTSTPLHTAAFCGSLGVAEILLRASIEIGAKNTDNMAALQIAYGEPWAISPLHDAVTMANLEMVKLMLEFKATIDQPEPATDKTPLYVAASDGQTDIVRCLLECEADVNWRDTDGQTPLHYAAARGHLELTRLLLESGAKPNIEGLYKWRPLHYAYDLPDVARLLLTNGADINAICAGGSPLYIATAKNNQAEVVRILLTHDDPPPNLHYEQDGWGGRQPTDRGKMGTARGAINGNHEAIVGMIPDYQPKLDRKNDSGYRLLYYISSEVSVSLAQRLINRGADPEITNSDGADPIWVAVETDNQPLAQYLAFVVKVKLNISVGEDAVLHYACRRGSLNMVKILTDAGANVNLDCRGLWGTPLQASFFRQEPSTDTLEILQCLIEKGAQVNAEGGTLYSALHAACLQSTPRAIELLISEGVNVDAKDSRTALHYAVVSGDVDLTRQVLDSHKRHPEHRDTYRQLVDADGWTPLHWAARTPKVGYGDAKDMVPVIEYLIGEGYDLTAKGKAMDQEWTALDVVVYHAVDEHIKLLLVPVKEGEPLTLTQKRPGKPHEGAFCDICLLCQASRRHLHPGHEFSPTSQEYGSEVEEWQPPSQYVRLEIPKMHPQLEQFASPRFDDEVVLEFSDSDDNGDDDTQAQF